jgi:hypothetical protein
MHITAARQSQKQPQQQKKLSVAAASPQREHKQLAQLLHKVGLHQHDSNSSHTLAVGTGQTRAKAGS